MIRPAQVLVPRTAFGGRSLLSACSVLNPVSVTVVRFDEVPRASKPPPGDTGAATVLRPKPGGSRCGGGKAVNRG